LVYLYILLEFQSTVDWVMAVRLMVYVGLLYQDLIRQGEVEKGGKLPPVLPIVLYNGERKWRGPLDVADLIEAAAGGSFHKYRPHLRYVLLEERKYGRGALCGLENLAGWLFRLENSGSLDELGVEVKALAERLKGPEYEEIRRAFTSWLGEVLLPRRLPAEELPELNELTEVGAMLAERVREWTRKWREEGLREGEARGRSLGLKEGLSQGEQAARKREINVILELLRRKGIDPGKWRCPLEKVESVEELSWILAEVASSEDPEDLLRKKFKRRE